MAGGYMGKLLFVNLSTGEIKEETPDESLYRDFIGGYGIGARILYSRQKGGVDPLGPENTLGLVTGPLTGTPPLPAADSPSWRNRRSPAGGETPIAAGISVPTSSSPAMMAYFLPAFRQSRSISLSITAKPN